MDTGDAVVELMPVGQACQPGCGFVVTGTQRCPRHPKRTTAQRGYGREHREERAAALPGAVCAVPGCGERWGLQRDHIIPMSMGGSQDASNKRWLCRPHHAALGTRIDGRGGAW